LNFSNIDGISFNVVQLERNPECIVCGSNQALNYNVTETQTLKDFIDELNQK
jgi:autonomous glycyl radical cofactor GrcA